MYTTHCIYPTTTEFKAEEENPERSEICEKGKEGCDRMLFAYFVSFAVPNTEE